MASPVSQTSNSLHSLPDDVDSDEDIEYRSDADEDMESTGEDEHMDEDDIIIDEDSGNDEASQSSAQDAIRQLLQASAEPESDGTPSMATARALLALFRRHNRQNVEPEDFSYGPPEEDIDSTGWSRAAAKYVDSKEATPRGLEVLGNGEFGSVRPARRLKENGIVPASIRGQRMGTRRMHSEDLFRDFIPNTHGTVVATYQSKAYVGQFSNDSSIYYTCTQDFDLHMYNARTPIATFSPNPHLSDYRHRTTMEVSKSILNMGGHWTVTDSHLSPDNSALIYSSLASTMYLVKMQDAEHEQVPICLGGSVRHHGYWYGSDPAIYSCRFSTDGKEIVAGGSQGGLYVYDLEAMTRSLRIEAHDDDINSCCWADTASGNVLVSASDDTTLKVWDRRSFGTSQKPSGVLIGHTEGITHVGPKGDGRYVISNGKDQVLRLWDLRKMRTHNEWKGSNPYRHRNYDYRRGIYPKPRHEAHPLDTSVMAYKGHSVLRTLIRCHFSPAESTGSSYVCSGSFDGMVHIWSLDGRVVQVLDRSKTTPITYHPSEPDPGQRAPGRSRCCVRDVSWQTTEPVLMSCAWESDTSSSVARHEWKGYGKNAMTIEDVLERDQSNAAHAADIRRRTGGSVP